MNRGLDCSARAEPGTLRRRVLRKVDNELAKGNTKGALTLVKQLQGKPGGLRGFGAAKQVPYRHYTLEGLNLKETEVASFQTVVDSTLDSVERSLQFTAFDVASSAEEMETLMLDRMDPTPSEDYHNMCKQHEAGHFLIAYLIGILPKGYIIPRMEDMEDESVGGRVDVIGFEFLNSVSTKTFPKIKAGSGKVCATVNRAKVSNRNLNTFSCVALAGLAAECLVFGYSEGSFCDVEKLDELLKWLGYTEGEANSQVRWAVLNNTLILRRHLDARSKLADAMALGKSIGFCIDTIENALDGKEI
ncbi:translation initiation factor 3 subunit I [Thalictrum thalictroides]|uniref:Translation initiation factor 3 subunit I n=1 Tax=Thalictrum thalictroides TaxID=46969 RepID=A0A7J6V6K0_THATH|nr:translation initiation factor 3 subunit I [Thalictrum thalictroides]